MSMITRQAALGSDLKRKGSEKRHAAEMRKTTVVIEEDQDTVHLGLWTVYIHI